MYSVPKGLYCSVQHFPLSLKSSRQHSPHRGDALSASRRRIFAIITLLIPVLFFVLLEVVLRFAGYGPDLSLFVHETIAGKDALVVNASVKARYFSRFEFNPSTSPDTFEPVKTPGTFRIFCLGGSTTVGYPYWFYGSFSSFLRDRLFRIFPDKQIEIINCGMTATNSFTALDMAEDIMPYEPDLIIDYDGHNEFYGALGVASHESIAGSRWLTNLTLRLIHFKVFYLLRNTLTHVASLFAGSEQDAGTMMEKLARGQYIPYDSPLYETGLSIWRDNIDDLVALCRSHSVPIIFGTQVSNLRDLPPFVSGSLQGLSAADQDRRDEALGRGDRVFRSGNFPEALMQFQAAFAIDSVNAHIAWMIAKCFDNGQRFTAARTYYRKARDLDNLRFRASSDFNNVLLNLSSPNVRTVDMERVFRNDSPDFLIGNNLILEHLHPNSRGYFLLAKAYAAEMRSMGLLGPLKDWKTRDTVSDEILWERRSVTPVDEITARRRTEVLTSGWPFRDQFPTVPPVDETDTLAAIVEHVVHGEWNWKQVHEAAADYYVNRRDFASAAKEYEVIIDQVPLFDLQSYLRLARLYLTLNNVDGARQMLLTSLSIKPTILAYRALGDIALQSGKPADAVPFYEKMSSFTQSPREQVDNGYLLGLAYARSGQRDKAIQQLVRVLNINPDYRPALELMTGLRDGK